MFFDRESVAYRAQPHKPVTGEIRLNAESYKRENPGKRGAKCIVLL